MKKRHFIILHETAQGTDESQKWSKIGIKYGARTPVAESPPPAASRRVRGKGSRSGKNSGKPWLKHVSSVDYYPGFAVATTDLTDEEAAQLCKREDVKDVVPDTKRTVPATKPLGPQILPDPATGQAGYHSADGKTFINLDLKGGATWLPVHVEGDGLHPYEPSTGTVRPFDKSGVKLPIGGGSGGGVPLPFDVSGVSLPFNKSGVKLPIGGGSGGGVPLPFDKSGVKLPFDISGVPLPFDASSPASSILHYALGSHDAMSQLLQRFTASATTAAAAPQPLPTSADLAWNIAALGIRVRNEGGQGIKVAVLDTGIDLDHPDFAPLKDEGRLICQNFTADGSASDVTDHHGHGTHCCGIIAGPSAPIAARDLPRYAISPKVTLLVGKVLGNNGEGSDTTIADGLCWALRNGAQIICLSLGEERQKGIPYSSLYEQMADVAATTSGFNALLVSAAGNFSSLSSSKPGPIADPAACPSFMAVGAINSQLSACDFSSVQCDDVSLLDICAPGDGILSTAKGGGYELRSGTSMAAPHVAAIAALYLQQNPDLSINELWSLLERRALPLGRPDQYGRGMVRLSIE